MPDGADLEVEMHATVRPRAREWHWFLLVLACGVAVDSAAKALVGGLPLGSTRHVTGPLSLRHVENPGIGIGYLAAGRVVPIVIGLVILALVVCFSAWGGIHPVFPVACGVAVGGCVGNLLDRLADGRVTDFVSVGALPVFNLADVFLVAGFVVMVGVCLLIDVREGQSAKQLVDGSPDRRAGGPRVVAELALRFLAREVHR